VYVEQGWTLTDVQVVALKSVCHEIDLSPGPGGSRITVLGHVKVGPIAGRGAVVALYPSSQLVAHVDPPIAGRRYHLPLEVNDGCWVVHGGDWQQLVVGHVYEMDPTETHGAVNWGQERRLHLMVDTED